MIARPSSLFGSPPGWPGPYGGGLTRPGASGLWLVPPQWAVLVLLFWVMTAPEAVGMVSAWVAGLLVDSLTGSLLGQHALTYVLIAWAGRQLRSACACTQVQQTLIVFLTVLGAEVLAALLLRLVRGQALSFAMLGHRW